MVKYVFLFLLLTAEAIASPAMPELPMVDGENTIPSVEMGETIEIPDIDSFNEEENTQQNSDTETELLPTIEPTDIPNQPDVLPEGITTSEEAIPAIEPLEPIEVPVEAILDSAEEESIIPTMPDTPMPTIDALPNDMLPDLGEAGEDTPPETGINNMPPPLEENLPEDMMQPSDSESSQDVESLSILDYPEIIEEEEDPIWSGSIMFNAEALRKIGDALEAYEKGLDYVEKAPEEAAPEEAPQEMISITEMPTFFLDSIMYFSPENWALWINGKKLSSDKRASDGLRVVDIDNKKATLIWTSNAFTTAVPDWKEQLSALEGISFDEASAELTFTLHPNQAIDISDLSIREGKTQAAASPSNNNSNTMGSAMPDGVMPPNPMQDINISPQGTPRRQPPQKSDGDMEQLYQKELQRVQQLQQLQNAIQ